MRTKVSVGMRAARVTAAWLLLGAAACPGFGDRVPTGRVTWESDVSRIMQTACGECHGAQPSQGAPFPLVTYAQTKPFAERIQVRAYQLRSMPPSGSMPEEDREKLYLWWQAGAPEDDADVDAGPDAAPLVPDGGPPPDGEPPPVVPTWEGEIEPIISSRCAGCHGDPLVAGAPYALATYEQVVEHKDRVVARAVESDTMPPGQALSDTDQDVLTRWVEGGTPR